MTIQYNTIQYNTTLAQLRLQIHPPTFQYVFLFHGNSGYANGPQFTLPVFLLLLSSSSVEMFALCVEHTCWFVVHSYSCCHDAPNAILCGTNKWTDRRSFDGTLPICWGWRFVYSWENTLWFHRTLKYQPKLCSKCNFSSLSLSLTLCVCVLKTVCVHSRCLSSTSNCE